MLFDALLRRPDIDADMIKKFESKLEEKKRNSNKGNMKPASGKPDADFILTRGTERII